MKKQRRESPAEDWIVNLAMKEDVQKLAAAVFHTVKTVAERTAPAFINHVKDYVATNQRQAAATEDVAEAAQTIAGHLGDIANMMRQQPAQNQAKGPTF